MIAAAVHVDGTARIQTVDRAYEPSALCRDRGICRIHRHPRVLNTSFNLREPIVETPAEAISCYLRTQMDVLVLGNFYSTRSERLTPARDVAELPVPVK